MTSTTNGPAPAPLSGRKAQAARNNETILIAARTIFMREPAAPMAAVAREAQVGISALYRRYASKEELLRFLCADGLRRYIAVAEEARAADIDAGEAFRMFLRGIVDADVHSLTVHLAGTFRPTSEHRELSQEAGRQAGRLLKDAKAAGAVREDFHLNDLAMVLEQITAVRLEDPRRTQVLRQRYLKLQLDGLRPESRSEKLPGPAPTSQELGARWTPPSDGTELT